VAIVGLVLVIAAILVAKALFGPDPQAADMLRDPIEASQQTALEFGERSHWLQPWRAYLDTVPAQRLRDAVGINFNVGAAEAPANGTAACAQRLEARPRGDRLGIAQL